jgi:hypothetical protein
LNPKSVLLITVLSSLYAEGLVEIEEIYKEENKNQP